MKISIPISHFIDDILAHSAIKALSSPQSANILSPDNSPALRRFIVVAAADIAGLLARRLVSFVPPDPDGDNPLDPIVFEFDDPPTVSSEALSHHISSAVSLSALRLIAIASGDNTRADAYLRCRSDSVARLADILDPPAPSRCPRIRPSWT